MRSLPLIGAPVVQVYEEAHKFHHYLHDTTPFDAHVYGAGAPEEWFSMVVEVEHPDIKCHTALLA